MIKDIVITNETGIHARPAMEIVKEASKFKSNIYIIKEDKEFNAKSVVGLMSMACLKGDKISIKAEGEDAESAIYSLIDLIQNRIK